MAHWVGRACLATLNLVKVLLIVVLLNYRKMEMLIILFNLLNSSLKYLLFQYFPILWNKFIENMRLYEAENI